MNLDISITTEQKVVRFKSILDNEYFDKRIDFKSEKAANDFVESIEKAFKAMTKESVK